MFLRIKYFLFTISLLFLHLLWSHFPKLVQLVSQNLVLVEIATFSKRTVVDFPVDEKPGEKEDEHDQGDDDFFKPLGFVRNVEPVSILQLLIVFLFLAEGVHLFVGSHKLLKRWDLNDKLIFLFQ